MNKSVNGAAVVCVIGSFVIGWCAASMYHYGEQIIFKRQEVIELLQKCREPQPQSVGEPAKEK